MNVVLLDLAEPSVTATFVSKKSNQPIDTNTGNRPSNLHNGQVRFSADGNLIIAWGIGKGFQVWDWKTGTQKFSTEFADNWSVYHLAVSPTGDRLALVNDENNRLAMVDCTDGRIVREFEHAAKIRSVEFAASGNEILTACDDGRARIMNVLASDGKTIDFVHNKKVLDACFSPDGSSIATLTNEMRVYLWRVRDRQWAMKPMSVPKGTQELLFSPDSNYLITMGFGKANDSRILDLSSFDGNRKLDLKYVTMLGELLSAKSIGDGTVVNLTSAEWFDRWRRYEEACLRQVFSAKEQSTSEQDENHF
ncbi:MAG: hypothetical protein ABL921_25755 [Pirellula sp.]